MDAEQLDEAADEGGASDDLPTARAVLTYVARQIVANPDAVTVEVDRSGRVPRLDLRVAPGDMGRVIGKRGRVANSIRTVVRAAAARDGAQVDVEFVD